MNEQLLKDFIATAQKYNYDWNTVFGKFPELKGYDQQVLKDYVATAEQNNYDYSIVNSKFPELGFQPSAPQQEEEVKKKDLSVTTELPSEGSSLDLQSQQENKLSPQALSDLKSAWERAQGKTPTIQPQPQQQPVAEEQQPIETFQGFTPEQKKQMEESMATQSYMGMTAPSGPVKKSEKKTYVENLGTNLMAGLNDVNEMISSVPESIYDVFSIPQNALAYATGWDISTNSDKFKKTLGVENPVLDYYRKEGEKLEQNIQKFNEENYKSSSIYDNIKDGNYGDAFELLGSGIVRSAPVSVSMMVGGATLSPMELTAASTVGFYGPNQTQLQQDNPNASDIENNIKALTMSAAETVFSAVGEGQIGAVYRDIIKKEGVEAGTQIFKTGLVDMYKEAIKKYGIPVGLLGEGLEEAATQITQNMVSGKPAFEGAADAFILGGGSGVAFTAPISLKNAKDRIVNEVAKIDDKKQINSILSNNEAKLHTLFDVSKDDAINESQFKIASLGKSRDLLVKDLSENVRKGVITQEQANQSLYVFDKTQQVAGQLRNVDIDEPSKVKVANLLKERDALSEKIQGKDEALSVLEKERIGQINEEIKKTIIDSKAKAETTKPSYSINGKEMSESDFSKAISEMPVEEVKKADIKATNASESVTNLLKDVATRSGVESAPMMETTAPAPAVPTTAAPEAQPVIPEEIASLKDDEPVTVRVKTLEEVPEQFRDRAEKSKTKGTTTIREKILGLPIGKKTTTPIDFGYTYTITGKEAKDYAIQKSKSEEAQPAKPEEEVTTNKQINRGDLKISVDGTTQGLGNIISENYSEKEDGPIKDKRFSVNTRNPIKVESTVKDNGNTELNVVVYHPDNVGRDGAVQFKIEIPKGVQVNSQEIENIVKEKTKQVKLDPQKDAINYKKGVESYLNDIVDNIIKPKENAIQKPTTEESVLRTEQPEVELPTMGEGNAQETTTQEGITPAKPEEVKPTEVLKDVDYTAKGGNKVVDEKGEPLVVYRSTYKENNLNDGVNYFAEDANYSKKIATIMNADGKASDYVETKPIKTIPVNISAKRVYELPKGIEMNGNIIKELTEKDPNFTKKYDAVKGIDLYSDNKTVYAVFDKANIREIEQSLAETPKTEVKSEVEDLLDLDVKSEDNLLKIYDFLDKIDNDLKSFGDETLGMNVSVVAARGIVKTIKALVKGGMLLRDAIKKVAADNKLSEKEVNDILNTEKIRVNVAPFFDRKISNSKDAVTLRESNGYKQHIKTLNKLASDLGLKINIEENIGGYKNDAGNDIVEISNTVFFENATIEQAEEFAALSAALTPEVQEASIAGKYVDENSPDANATEITISVGDIDAAIEALKKSNILNYSINEKDKTVSIIDVKDFSDIELQRKIGNFTNELSNNNIEYGKEKYRAIESRYVGAGKRKEILRRIKKEGTVKGQAKSNFRNTFVRAVKRDAQFQKTTVEEYEGKQPAAGNRLFSKPVKGVATIADRYYKRVFGKERPKYLGSRELNKERAKKISDAFIAMKHDPFNPEVRAAYEALAKETIDQYKAFLDAGYVVEVNNEEPYANSEEMINDLRDNKRIKIFSTESGFGDTPITEKQRSENPLLAKTEFLDKNGNPLLVNDLFRAIHDFFGHAELGNAFGPKGEENAWNVHARMFSDLARKAMTTETRGQNSYVNFSGVNEKVKALREKARELRENGDEEGAQKIVSEIYEIASFADQKVGLLPKEFYEIDKADIGDVKKQKVVLEDLLDLDTKDKTNLQKVYDFLDKTDKDLTNFSKQTLGVNISIPVMKAIVKSLKVLVKGGMTLQEAITKVAKDNKVSFDDVVKGMKTLAETVSAETVEGYDDMMNAVNDEILRALNRKTSQQTILNNVMKIVEGSDAYKNATDQQREQIIRDVKKAFGEKIKPAPSAKKILGFLKDVKKVTMDEMSLLKQRLKDMAKGAKTAESAINKASKNLTESLKDLVKKGDITTKQMLTVLRKFSKTNLLDDSSVDKFVNYMTKVFADAEYADKISKAYTQLKIAKKNIKTKIGIAEDLHPLLRKIFSVNPNLIPDAVFEKYLGLVDMFGQKKQVLKLDNKQDVVNLANEIIDAIDEELSLSEELADRFSNYADKVVDANGKVDYAATIQAMVKDNTITEDEAKIMRKYKSNIFPSAKATPKTDAELAQEKQDLLTALNGVDIDTENLPTHDEREIARKLDRLIRSNAVNEMTNEQLTNLLKVIDNINNGYLPHYSQLMLERLNALNKGADLKNAINKAKPLSLSKIYANLKSIFTRKDSISEMVRRNPLYYIDQVFGNFKSKDIFDSLFKSSAEAKALFMSNITKIQNKLDNAQDAVAKSFKNNPNKTMMSKFKMMTYMIQLEYQSNPNSKQVNPASEYLKATIKHIDEGKSSFGERDADMLQKVLDDYSDANGNIDIDKLYNSFNEAEKKAIATIKEVNESLREKAIHTAAIIRGDKINPLENYVHLNVLHDAQPDDAISGVTSAEAYNNSLRPSTKAKSLIARTGKVAPLNFDVFASAHRGAKFVLMDYYLTEPIRTARKTINEATAMMEKNGRIPKEKRQILNTVSNAFEETTENILNNVFVTNSFADEVVNYMSKSGYRAVLASVPRFIAELTSNIGFALFTDPKALATGHRYRNVVMSSDAVKILNNVGSKQTNRIFPHETLSGRLIDTSIMSQASGIKGGRAKSDVANVIQMLYNNSLKKYKNSVETLADALISTPDKMIMRPLWIGSFANEFKRLTGKDVDFDKIANNDEAYMLENKDAIDDARDIADQRSVLTGATDNPYMDILKGKVKPNQSALARGFNMFNNYMTRFTIYEYTTARTGIMAAMGNGSLSRKQGVALMAGVTTRMVLYTLLAQTLGSGMVGLFVDDDDDDDEKSITQKFGQSLISTFTSLFIGRDFGNATKTIVNYGLERVNENYLDFLREGDYDPYKDAIQYSIIPPDVKGKKTTLTDYITNMGGPFAPSLKTADLIARKLSEEPKKKEEAIERSENEVGIRIPLEILGNVGLVPLYKDIRKITMKSIYKDLEKAEKDSSEKDDLKPYGLNKEELKRYMPDVYEKYYGEGTSYAKDKNTKSKIRKKKDELRRKMLDERYNYVSPKEKGFGSSDFGQGTETKTKSKKDSFGSAEFGSK